MNNKIKLVISVLLICTMVFSFCGCKSESAVEERMVIISSGEEFVPYYALTSTMTYSSGWMSLSVAPIDKQAASVDFPVVTFEDDFQVNTSSKVVWAENFSIYDEDFEIIEEISYAEFSSLDSGSYYISTKIIVNDNYIEAADGYETSGYTCWFALNVN